MIAFLNQICKNIEFHNQWYYTIACFSYTINFSFSFNCATQTIALLIQWCNTFTYTMETTAFLIDLVIQHKQLQFIIDHEIKTKKKLSFEKVIQYRK